MQYQMKNYMKEQNNKCCKEVSKKKEEQHIDSLCVKISMRKTVQAAYDYEKQNYIQQKQPPKVFCKKGVLEILQNSQKNTCARVSFFNKAATLLKRDSGTGVFL